MAAVRAIDAIDPFDPGFDDALADGVTSMKVNAGSGNPIPEEQEKTPQIRDYPAVGQPKHRVVKARLESVPMGALIPPKPPEPAQLSKAERPPPAGTLEGGIDDVAALSGESVGEQHRQYRQRSRNGEQHRIGKRPTRYGHDSFWIRFMKCPQAKMREGTCCTIPADHRMPPLAVPPPVSRSGFNNGNEVRVHGASRGPCWTPVTRQDSWVPYQGFWIGVRSRYHHSRAPPRQRLRRAWQHTAKPMGRRRGVRRFAGAPSTGVGVGSKCSLCVMLHSKCDIYPTCGYRLRTRGLGLANR